ALAGARGLIAQLRIADARPVHAKRELLGGLVDIEFLERKKVVGQLRIHAPTSERNMTAPASSHGAAGSWQVPFAIGMDPQLTDNRREPRSRSRSKSRSGSRSGSGSRSRSGS